jgi:hypothetical protein
MRPTETAPEGFHPFQARFLACRKPYFRLDLAAGSRQISVFAWLLEFFQNSGVNLMSQAIGSMGNR